jgi:type IV secretory pathway TrbL component
MVNLLVWNAWGIIYAIISQLLTIMSANSLNSIFTSQSFGGAFQGASQMLLISLSSILLSIMILLIPFIAKRVVSGDVGSTMLTVVGVAAAAVQTAIAGWAGMQAGAASGASGGGDDGGGGGGGGGFSDRSGASNRPPSPPSDGNNSALGGVAEASGHAPPAPGGAAMVDASGESGGGAAAAGNRPPNDPPSTPRQSQGRPGHFGHYNIPHAVGWTVGTWAGATQRTVSSAFRSSQKQEEEV